MQIKFDNESFFIKHNHFGRESHLSKKRYFIKQKMRAIMIENNPNTEENH